MKSNILKKYNLEFIFVASPKRLFYYLSNVDGLSEWFADSVKFKDETFHFCWGETEQQALIVNKKENEFIRFRWLDEDEDVFFEFAVSNESISNEITLIITDFSFENEIKNAEMVWNEAVKKLIRLLGTKLINPN